MEEIKKEIIEKVILIAVADQDTTEAEESLDELEELVKTAGAEVAARVIQVRETPHPGTYIGKGKIDEVNALLYGTDATGIVCDDELSPAQISNLEEALDTKVMDRTLIILDIFAKRAFTREGKIQVELAQLKYRASKLTGQGRALSRLGGGIGTRGPGEKKLEMDRRLIRTRISRLKAELRDVVKHREVQRKQRQKNHLPVVCIVGYTNAGKSTLLSAVSSAKPKIANYPFTTLEPNLGIVSYRDGKSFVMADIPGIIEGASAGKGLGLRFLRHIERNSLLLFMVPADSDDIRKEYEILLNELRTFNPEMLDKQRVLAITKCDMLDQELMDEIEPTLPESIPHVFISAISGLGISTLKDMLWEELNKESNKIEGKIESIAHRAKDMSHLKEELKDEGEDEDLSYEYVDDEDIEDLEDFEYEEEDWEDDRK